MQISKGIVALTGRAHWQRQVAFFYKFAVFFDALIDNLSQILSLKFV